MKIRAAQCKDREWLAAHDRHVSGDELSAIIKAGRIHLCESDNGAIIGWLLYNLFWDNIPFMNMLYFLPEYRRLGYGNALVAYWEHVMAEQGHQRVMTSSQEDEEAQHFFRRLQYSDAGSLLLPGEPPEILFIKTPGDGHG